VFVRSSLRPALPFFCQAGRSTRRRLGRIGSQEPWDQIPLPGGPDPQIIGGNLPRDDAPTAQNATYRRLEHFFEGHMLAHAPSKKTEGGLFFSSLEEMKEVTCGHGKQGEKVCFIR